MKADRPVELQVNDVTVSYANGMVALRDASFRLTGGAICGLVGVNGSGKSTLFKAIMDFVRPVRGAVLIAGRPVRAALKANLVAYVPQAEEVDWTFPVSVWDVVLMGRYGYMNFLRIHARRTGASPRRAWRGWGCWISRAPDRRAVRRTEKARLPRPRARPAEPGHPARRAVHRAWM
jgi:ABC-type Mn2+/Zn2+ transport system ATPase subunit